MEDERMNILTEDEEERRSPWRRKTLNHCCSPVKVRDKRGSRFFFLLVGGCKHRGKQIVLCISDLFVFGQLVFRSP